MGKEKEDFTGQRMRKLGGGGWGIKSLPLKHTEDTVYGGRGINMIMIHIYGRNSLRVKIIIN